MFLILIVLAVIIFFVWLSATKKKHIDYSKKTVMPKIEWYFFAKNSTPNIRGNLSKHLILETARLLDRSDALSDKYFAELINLPNFNASNFILNIMDEIGKPDIDKKFHASLSDNALPMFQYLSICIVAIMESSYSFEEGLLKLKKISLKSCGADIDWKY